MAGERLFEVLLPEEVGGRVEEGEDDELEEGGEVDGVGFLWSRSWLEKKRCLIRGRQRKLNGEGERTFWL